MTRGRAGRAVVTQALKPGTVSRAELSLSALAVGVDRAMGALERATHGYADSAEDAALAFTLLAQGVREAEDQAERDWSQTWYRAPGTAWWEQ